MYRKRIRDYGLTVGKLPTGVNNTIADVPGVKVGHVTLSRFTGYPPEVCTGVTAILPHSGNWFDNKVTAATHVINGYGKTAGLLQVEELGVIESPILLTNTLSVPAAMEGTIQYMLHADDHLGEEKGSLNVVVGECNDGYLNHLRGLPVGPEHARDAITRALASTTVSEGSVGAGAGMRCFGWKGGIGTASRCVEIEQGRYVIGTLVLTNFGDAEDLTVLGVPIGQWLRPEMVISREAGGTTVQGQKELQQTDRTGDMTDGSIMIVLATNLPLDSRQLKRLARRAVFGLARTGSIAHHGSGDVVIAFSTAGGVCEADVGNRPFPAGDGPIFSTFFRAVVESTEEAILNSLATATTTIGQQERVVPNLPMEEVMRLFKSWRGPVAE